MGFSLNEEFSELKAWKNLQLFSKLDSRYRIKIIELREQQNKRKPIIYIYCKNIAQIICISIILRELFRLSVLFFYSIRKNMIFFGLFAIIILFKILRSALQQSSYRFISSALSLKRELRIWNFVLDSNKRLTQEKWPFLWYIIPRILSAIS